jgi:hypothetical protein
VQSSKPSIEEKKEGDADDMPQSEPLILDMDKAIPCNLEIYMNCDYKPTNIEKQKARKFYQVI